MAEQQWSWDKKVIIKKKPRNTAGTLDQKDTKSSGVMPVLPGVDDRPPGSETQNTKLPVLEAPKKEPDHFFQRILKKIADFFHALFSRQARIKQEQPEKERQESPEQQIGIPRTPVQKESSPNQP